MRLIVQPEHGVAPLLDAIALARSRIDIVIFRFDVTPVERALYEAVARGVEVRALVAHTNNNGEKKLRDLEVRFARQGVAVTRTGADFVRYHGKLLLIDGVRALILGFNYTWRDIRRSRSLGADVTDPAVVAELSRLVEVDAVRGDFAPEHPDLVISPENSRARLSRFIKKARRDLMIYDPNVCDDAMIRLLKARAAGGVRVRILGNLEKKWRGEDLRVEELPGKRLHVRAIIRDGRDAFVGSQSLRKLELDGRREVGIIVRDAKVVGRLIATFKADWKRSPAPNVPDATERRSRPRATRAR